VVVGFTVPNYVISENEETVTISIYKLGDTDLSLQVTLTALYNTTGM